MKEKSNIYSIVAIVMVAAVSCIGGGYFVFASAVLSVVLMCILLTGIWRSGQYRIAMDWNMLSLVVVSIGYLCVSIWAVDQGMAFTGFIKFLPVMLFGLYMCRYVNNREWIIQILPYIGSLMTLFSIIMMQFKAFRGWVTVAGRLSGFFQYPNTYAVFMLICMVLAIYEFDIKKTDIWNIFNIVAAVAGILLSGSRMVYLLFILTIVLLVIHKKEIRKMAIGIMGVGVLVILAETLFGSGNIMHRIMTITTSSSTLLGRILYWKDAVGIVLKHPFGTGYYGYYYLQQEVQTGVYSVVNAHNELLQLMLDIGVIPALIIYGNLIRLIVKSENTRNRIILLILVMHSLFDYDLQFAVMWMVLILFMDFKNMKEGRIPIFSKVCVTVAGIVAAICTVFIGSSDAVYMQGNSKLALKLYEGNMQARISVLSDTKGAIKLKKQAENILERNSHVSVAYSALALSAFSDGDIESYIKYKLTAIKMAPYQYDEYVDYLDTLLYCADEYLDSDDKESARTCVLRAAQVPELLKEAEEKTSSLGWKIHDIPQVRLSHSESNRIEEYQNKINQN